MSNLIPKTLKEEVLSTKDMVGIKYGFVFRNGISGIIQSMTSDTDSEDGYFLYNKIINGNETVYKKGILNIFRREAKIEIADCMKFSEYKDDLTHKYDNQWDVIKIWLK